jgi:predicted dinucleotide-binding enzyme
MDDVLSQAGDLSGKVVLNCSLPMDGDELIVGLTSSGCEQLATRLPNAHIVSAFCTTPSEALFGVFDRRNDADRSSLIYFGDDAASKEVASELIRDVGFDPIDAGALRLARYTEPFGVLVAAIAYDGSQGPELSYRLVWGKRPLSRRSRSDWSSRIS